MEFPEVQTKALEFNLADNLNFWSRGEKFLDLTFKLKRQWCR